MIRDIVNANGTLHTITAAEVFAARFEGGYVTRDTLRSIHKQQDETGEAVTISPLLSIGIDQHRRYYIAIDTGKQALQLQRLSGFYGSLAEAAEALNRYNSAPARLLLSR